ncbi:alanine racemase [Paenibacillus sp. 1011MAR3C5]|uniref:alanine racemase n=1 Tax=Paenibacillus sp. 1011MAR3C5 TaxID=1675787 RepID=UPI000E6D37A9|nr:alanine racemase [Paenibacillus sp. 1011MAR3C5]RJE85576.1 alanine racemase [Paenibacillus sp. 1011MAR3C5]
MYRDTRAKVSLGAIRENTAEIRRLMPESAKLMAVVKADGYGHGSVASARAAAQGGADHLAVAYLEEALLLRSKGIELPILILAPIHPSEVMLAIRHQLMVTVTHAEWFRQMAPYREPLCKDNLRVHVKVDTGLGRIGLRTKEEWDELVPWLQWDFIDVDGFYTHFATSAREDTAFLRTQLAKFLEMKEWSRTSGIEARHYHCAGSNAALRFPELAMDMVRIGAALFGFYPEQLVSGIHLRPALSLYSRLIQVKQLRKGECIGYDNSYVAEEDEWIGTVPIGYGDGWSQSLQNTEMLVEGRRAQVVGKICMDQLMIRLDRSYEAGTEVVLIGSQREERVAITELALHAGTVSQEISTSLSSRVERIYKE